MASTEYHEPPELLSQETKEMHRALVSAIEELEAIDWYQQRADACEDEDLRAILLHNKEEEMEHFLMTLEWIRRRSPKFSSEMKKYLFTEGPLTQIEEKAEGGGEAGGGSAGGSLGIGALKPRSQR
jgi:ferritin-like protein